jgi:hypothetical protein
MRFGRYFALRPHISDYIPLLHDTHDSRCFSIVAPCIPPSLAPAAWRRKGRKDKRKRGQTTGANDDDLEEEEEEKIAEVATSNTIIVKHTREEALSSSPPSPACHDVILEMIFTRINPRNLSQIFMQAFEQISSEKAIMPPQISLVNSGAGAGAAAATNLLSPSSVMLPLVRTYRAQSRVLGVDVTWGVMGLTRKAFHLSPLDLEDKESLLWDLQDQKQGGDEGVAARWRALQLELDKERKSLEQQSSYQELLQKRPPPAAIYAQGTSKDGHQFAICNAQFAAFFRSVPEMAHDTAAHRANEGLLFLSLVAPEDRMAWCRFIWEVVIGSALQEKRPAEIIKMVDRHGDIGLYLVEAVPLAGEVPGLAIVLEPCPGSRHINPRPGIPYVRQVAMGYKNCVRAAYGNATSGGGDGGAGGAGASAAGGAVAADGEGGGGGGGGGSTDNVKEIVAKEGGNGMNHPSQQFGGQFPSLAMVPLAAHSLLQQPSSPCHHEFSLLAANPLKRGNRLEAAHHAAAAGTVAAAATKHEFDETTSAAAALFVPAHGITKGQVLQPPALERLLYPPSPPLSPTSLASEREGENKKKKRQKKTRETSAALAVKQEGEEEEEEEEGTTNHGGEEEDPPLVRFGSKDGLTDNDILALEEFLTLPSAELPILDDHGLDSFEL